MREQLERRVGRAERRGVGRMPVHDRADVGPRLVHGLVEHGLEVHVGREHAVGVVDRELDDVVGLHLVERDALALDVDAAVVVRAR